MSEVATAHRMLYEGIRALDTERRTATFIASTETGVQMSDGTEHVRMAGVDLGRFAKNPVVLANHWPLAENVIGRAKLTVAGRELLAEVEFARSRVADEIWGLVRDGFVKAMSIGFDPLEVRELRAGEKDGEIEGPATVITRWRLVELSVVAIGADENALRRAYQDIHEAHGRRSDMAEPEVEVGEAPPAETKEEASLRRERAQRERILLMAPADLEAFTEGLLLEQPDISVEDARKALLVERAKRAAPVGTGPAPAKEQSSEGEKLTPETLMRAFGLSGVNTGL